MSKKNFLPTPSCRKILEMEMRLETRKCGKFGDGEIGDGAFRDGNFPEWFLIEMLCRLPVKCVFRSKCVSKQWLAVISDPSFPRLYIARASSLSEPRPWAILSCDVNVKGPDMSDYPDNMLLGDMYSDDFNPLDCYVLPLPSSQEPRGNSYEIIAVSNGLVLYGWRHYVLGSRIHIAEYCIINPVTKTWFCLPPPKHCFTVVSTGFVTKVEAGILTSFKVVSLDYSFGKSNILRFEIYSSETGQWMDFTVCSDHAIEVAWCRMPVAFNGNLHWVDRELGIVAYDPYNNPYKFRVIGLPADIDKQCNDYRSNGIPSLCDVHQGRLKYFEYSSTFGQGGLVGFSIWVLNDYSTGEWHLQHRVNQSDILLDDTLLSSRISPIPVCYHPFDADIVLLGEMNIIVSYNMKKMSLEAHGALMDIQDMSIDDRRLGCWWWPFLLVLPLWPTMIPSSLSVRADD